MLDPMARTQQALSGEQGQLRRRTPYPTRWRKPGLDVKQQHPIEVMDEDGTIIGEFTADLLIENQLVVDLKGAKALADEQVAQLLGNLKPTRLEHGLLINSGSYKFQINNYVLSDRAPIALAQGSLRDPPRFLCVLYVPWRLTVPSVPVRRPGLLLETPAPTPTHAPAELEFPPRQLRPARFRNRSGEISSFNENSTPWAAGQKGLTRLRPTINGAGRLLA
jgi:GxxExxY protein